EPVCGRHCSLGETRAIKTPTRRRVGLQVFQRTIALKQRRCGGPIAERGGTIQLISPPRTTAQAKKVLTSARHRDFQGERRQFITTDIRRATIRARVALQIRSDAGERLTEVDRRRVREQVVIPDRRLYEQTRQGARD